MYHNLGVGFVSLVSIQEFVGHVERDGGENQERKAGDLCRIS
jgi:hypothetical protein